MYFQVQLKGAQSISKPVRFQATTAVLSQRPDAADDHSR